MKTYIVTAGQNIFDVALHLYGSIEGLFDIFISNPDVNMTTDLTAGRSLLYHEDFVINPSIVKTFKQEQIVPANSKGLYCYKPIPDGWKLRLIEYVSSARVTFKISGHGKILIDWGDSSDLQHVKLTTQLNLVSHDYDDTEEKIVKIYGDFELSCLDFSGVGGVMRSVCPIVVDKYINHDNYIDLSFIQLFRDTYLVDIANSGTDSLLPLLSLTNLQELHLENVLYRRSEALDEYLEGILNAVEFGDRTPCKVYLTQEPGEQGHQAIQTILNEPEWNTPMAWEFYINGNLVEADGTNP